MAERRRHFDDDPGDRDHGWAGRARDEVRSWFGDDASQQRRGNDERDDRYPYGGDRQHSHDQWQMAPQHERAEIADRMTDDWMLDASDISVTVTDGEVTLDGTVPTRDQKRHANETPGKSTSGTSA